MAQRNEQLDRLKRDRGALVAALERSGAVVKGKTVRCPFHEDRSPSARTHQGRDGVWRFKCFACQWNGAESTGDVVDVVRRAQNCDFNRALEILGIESSHAMSKPKPTREKTNGSLKAERNGGGDTKVPIDARQAAERLLSDSAALELLWRTRGVDRAMVERFGIGIGDRYDEDGFVGRYWTFPVADGVIKLHRVDATYEPKA